MEDAFVQWEDSILLCEVPFWQEIGVLRSYLFHRKLKSSKLRNVSSFFFPLLAIKCTTKQRKKLPALKIKAIFPIWQNSLISQTYPEASDPCSYCHWFYPQPHITSLNMSWIFFLPPHLIKTNCIINKTRSWSWMQCIHDHYYTTGH